MKSKFTVLLAVIKNKRDLDILLRKRWYRIPSKYIPKRKADYISFYQPSLFGNSGKCIHYYARIKDYKVIKRKRLLPEEPHHKSANKNYYKINFDNIKKLKKPITNKNKMRISFGFTSLEKLMKSKEIIELFDIPPIEKIVMHVLKRERIRVSRQYNVYLPDSKKYRLDFAVSCKKGLLNVECDGEKWHSSRLQKLRDIARDRALRKQGWKILRLREHEIVNNIEKCTQKIKSSVKTLGGTKYILIKR